MSLDLSVHSALAYIDWLEPRAHKSIPYTVLAIVTIRQRMIMLQLLDGVPRKQIAAALGLRGVRHTREEAF